MQRSTMFLSASRGLANRDASEPVLRSSGVEFGEVQLNPGVEGSVLLEVMVKTEDL